MSAMRQFPLLELLRGPIVRTEKRSCPPLRHVPSFGTPSLSVCRELAGLHPHPRSPASFLFAAASLCMERRDFALAETVRRTAALFPSLCTFRDIFAVAVEQSVGRRSPVPMSRSVAWLQRGCATAGFTFAQKPYSRACNASQVPTGRLSVKVNRTIDLMPLKPYFHGVISRIGAPCCFTAGLP